MPAGRAFARRLALVPILALALGVAAGCQDADDSPGGQAEASDGGGQAQPVGEESAGSVTQYADCEDWRKGSEDERRATVVELRGQLTPQTSETAESPLPDDRAYEILQKACKPSFSASLRLYKLYVRAQGFAPLTN